MADTTTYNYTTLAFDISQLFSIAKLQSLYAGSSVVDPSGITQEFAFAMTDNERDIFDVVLRQAAAKVYDALSQDTKLSTNPLRYAEVDPATGRSMIYYELYIHSDWDTAQSFGLSVAVDTALVNFVLKEWYKLRGNAGLYQVAEANYQDNIASVKNLLNRRVAPVTKVYRYV